MTHLVRHATRPRITASRAGADARPLSKGDASMQTPHVRETAWNGNNRTFAWDHLKLAHTLLDPEALEIFRSTATEEVTAWDLSRRCGMSLGRCYRWLRRLESLGLIVSREGRPQSSGVPPRRYRSALQSIGVSLADDQIRTRIAVREGSSPLVSECVTTIEGSDMIQVPGARSRHRKGGAEQVHFIDPPKSMRAVRRNLRINLPAFLEEEPLSRLPERR